MKKIRKIKKLFIDELETRKSTSPLFVQTMSAGEAGISAKEQGGASTKENLTNGQKAKEELVAKKNDSEVKIEPVKPPECIAMYAVKMPPDRVTTAAEGEETITPKPVIAKYAPPKPPEPIVVKYAPPKPPEPIVTKYAPPKPPEPIVVKYAPPQPTNKIGEDGPVPKPKPVIAQPLYAPPKPPEPKPRPLYAVPEPKPKPTTMAEGEEGRMVKPRRIPGSIIKRILDIRKEEE